MVPKGRLWILTMFGQYPVFGLSTKDISNLFVNQIAIENTEQSQTHDLMVLFLVRRSCHMVPCALAVLEHTEQVNKIIVKVYLIKEKI